MWHGLAGVDGQEAPSAVNGAPRTVAEDGRMEQLKLRQGHRNIFHECTALQSRGAMRKAPVVAPLFTIFQVAWPHKIDPLARASSSGDRTCLGQAGLAGR
eukprot:361596-Chlamydomonas_euryale.AAC.3